MEDLIYKVESSLNFKSPQTEEEVFNDYSTTKFLVIDEVGRSLKREKESCGERGNGRGKILLVQKIQKLVIPGKMQHKDLVFSVYF